MLRWGSLALFTAGKAHSAGGDVESQTTELAQGAVGDGAAQALEPLFG